MSGNNKLKKMRFPEDNITRIKSSFTMMHHKETERIPENVFFTYGVDSNSSSKKVKKDKNKESDAEVSIYIEKALTSYYSNSKSAEEIWNELKNSIYEYTKTLKEDTQLRLNSENVFKLINIFLKNIENFPNKINEESKKNCIISLIIDCYNRYVDQMKKK